MRKLCAIVSILLLASSAGAKPRHCMLRIHAEANPRDTDVFSTAVRATLSGKTVAIEKVARITENDVKGFYPYPQANGQYGVLLQLDDHGRITLDALSIERRGGYLFVFVDGRAITELQIDKRVSDGQIYIPFGLTLADIKLMRKDWHLIGKQKR